MKLTTDFSSATRPARLGSPRFATALLALAFAGCSILPEPVEDPTRYYVLGAGPTVTESGTTTPKGNLRLGLRSVELPLYLRNNRTIVVRTGSNEIRYQDFARWAEPLDLAVQRALRDRLLANEAVAGAEVPPFSTEVTRDFDLTVRVLQCEGGVDARGHQGVQFSAAYEILDQHNGGRVVLRKTFSAPTADWDGTHFAALAAQLSTAVAALADDIAANLPR